MDPFSMKSQKVQAEASAELEKLSEYFSFLMNSLFIINFLITFGVQRNVRLNECR
jgi:hypothetical protein